VQEFVTVLNCAIIHISSLSQAAMQLARVAASFATATAALKDARTLQYVLYVQPRGPPPTAPPAGHVDAGRRVMVVVSVRVVVVVVCEQECWRCTVKEVRKQFVGGRVQLTVSVSTLVRVELNRSVEDEVLVAVSGRVVTAVVVAVLVTVLGVPMQEQAVFNAEPRTNESALHLDA